MIARFRVLDFSCYSDGFGPVETVRKPMEIVKNLKNKKNGSLKLKTKPEKTKDWFSISYLNCGFIFFWYFTRTIRFLSNVSWERE